MRVFVFEAPRLWGILLMAFVLAFVLAFGQAAVASIIKPSVANKPLGSTLLDLDNPVTNATSVEGQGDATGAAAMKALSHGRWGSACSISTSVLVRQVQDVGALGIFSLCAALRNDRKAASISLERLHKTEATPYFSLLTEGVLFLRDRLPGKAEEKFKTILLSDGGDPLALYFSGEALHAQKKDAEATTAFKNTLVRWPDYAPSLAAAARLMAVPKAPRNDLNAAIVLVRHAVAVEPSNRGYWQMLADLYNRTGQSEQANAIAVQWLGRPHIK